MSVGCRSHPESKLSQLEGKLSQSEGKLSQLEGKLSQSEGKLSQPEGKLSQSEGKLSQLEGKLSRTVSKAGERLSGPSGSSMHAPAMPRLTVSTSSAAGRGEALTFQQAPPHPTGGCVRRAGAVMLLPAPLRNWPMPMSSPESTAR